MHLVQWIAVIVYGSVTLAGVVIAWMNKSGFVSVAKEKSLAEGDSGLPGIVAEAPNSFSRVVGLVGLMFLSTFIWCYGLFLLTGFNPATPSSQASNAIPNSAGGVGIFSDEVKNFIVASAALFAPYAANQLASALAALRGGTAPATVGAASASASTVAQLPVTPPPTW